MTDAQAEARAQLTADIDKTEAGYIKHLESRIRELLAALQASRDENARLQRTMDSWKESYLAEHETWGNCKWKAQLAERDAEIARLEAIVVELQPINSTRYNEGLEAAAKIADVCTCDSGSDFHTSDCSTHVAAAIRAAKEK